MPCAKLRCFCVLVIGFAGAGTILGGPQLPHSSIQQGLAKAQSAYENRQYKEADEILRGLLTDSLASFPANELLGLVLTAEGQHRAASQYFKAAVRANPSSVAARANLAANLAQLDQNVLAEREFKSALRLDPASYELNHNLGEFYARLGRFGEAIPLLTEAQRIQPLSYSNGYDLALAEMKAGMAREAELQIRALMKTQATAELHGLLGAVYESQAKFVEAASELQRAAQMEPTEGNLFDWGAELLRHQTLEPAIQVFSQGTHLFPRSWRMQVGLGLSLYLHEDNERAVEALCSAIDLAPSDLRSYSYLAEVTPIPPTKADQAVSRFQRYAEAEPRNPQALFFYALSLWNSSTEQGDGPDLARVEKLLHGAVTLNPEFAKAHLQLGILYSRQQNHAAAVRAYERATQLDPSLSLAHYRLGQTLIHLGDQERGKKELDIWNQLRSGEREKDEKARAKMFQFVYASPSEADSNR